MILCDLQSTKKTSFTYYLLLNEALAALAANDSEPNKDSSSCEVIGYATKMHYK